MTVDTCKSENLPAGLDEMRERYNCLVGTVAGIVYTLDEKGHFTSIGAPAESILGFSQEELINRHFSVILHPQDIESVSREFILPRFAGVSTGNECAPKLFDERRSWHRKTTDLNLRIRPKQGYPEKENRLLKCRANASGEYYAGRFIGTIGYMYDFVEENDASFALDNKQPYNAFELLATALSHVFSNVFTGIYGNLQLIEMQIDRHQNFQGNIEAIKSSIEKGVTLVRKLSKSLTAPQKSCEGIGLKRLLHETAEDLLRGAGLDFQLEFEPQLWRNESDPSSIRHIIRAVCFHIVRSVFNGGSVKIKAVNVIESRMKLPRIDCPYIMVVFQFSVPDNENIRERISELFSLERIASMALSFELLKRNGGLISTRNEGCNSIVELYLPAIRAG